MELLNNNNSRPDNSEALTTSDYRTLAVRQRYGDIERFCGIFNVNAQRYCANNIEKAIRDGVPTFAVVVRTYGEDATAQVIKAHMIDAILKMGEDREVDQYDVDFIARAVCESERFRLLTMASILRFFHLLKCGEFDIYGKVTPRKILEAFRRYAVEQQAKENRIAYEIAKEHKAKQGEEDRKNAVSWKAWAASHGIDPAISFAEYFARKSREAAEATETPQISRLESQVDG